jgi:archaellum component FlaC
MTGEEMERAIEFLLKNQARTDARLEQTIEQVNQTSHQLDRLSDRVDKLGIQVERLGAQVERLSTQVGNLSAQFETLAETQNEFMEVVTQHIIAQGEINASVRDSLSVLTATVDRYFNGGQNGKP